MEYFHTVKIFSFDKRYIFIRECDVTPGGMVTSCIHAMVTKLPAKLLQIQPQVTQA